MVFLKPYVCLYECVCVYICNCKNYLNSKSVFIFTQPYKRLLKCTHNLLQISATKIQKCDRDMCCQLAAETVIDFLLLIEVKCKECP